MIIFVHPLFWWVTPNDIPEGDVAAYKNSESQSKLLPRKCNLPKHSYKQVKQEYLECSLNQKTFFQFSSKFFDIFFKYILYTCHITTNIHYQRLLKDIMRQSSQC